MSTRKKKINIPIFNLNIIQPVLINTLIINTASQLQYKTPYSSTSNTSIPQFPIICTPILIVNEMDQIINGLWLGGITTEQKIIDNNFTHVLSIIDKKPEYYNSVNFKTKWINIIDDGNENIEQYFTECSDFIHQIIQDGGNVYVHCQKGLSRSPTIVIAYIMKYGICNKRYSFDEALKFVSKKRQAVCPNLGFNIALRNYELNIVSV